MDPFEFHLAKELGMTVGELRERMTQQEYVEWVAYYTWKAAMDDMQRQRSQNLSK